MNLLNKVPGFRSKKKPKMIVASIYYICQLISLLAVMGEIDLMLMVSSTLVYPFIVFGIIDLIKNKNKLRSQYGMRKVVMPIVLSILLMYASLTINTSTGHTNVVQSSKVADSSENSKENETEDKPQEESISKVEETELHFINTGNSDSILIKQGTKAALIDGGDNDDEQKVVSYIKDQGISELEYVFATHPHADHIGGLDAVVNDIAVKNMFVSNGDSNSETYSDFINAMANKGLSPSVPLLNSEFKLGTSTFKVLSVANQNDPNNNSIVLLYTNGEDKVLLMGDAEADIESKINPGDIDLLKVGHHGSHSSSTNNFIGKITPEYAVITVGSNNSYGHPHKETMDTLKNSNVEVHRTDECGNIVFKSNGNGLVVDCKEGSYNPGKDSSSSSSKNDENSNTNVTTIASSNNNSYSTNESNISNIESNNTNNNEVTQPEPEPQPQPSPQPSSGRTVYANGGSSTSNKYHSSPTAHNMEGAIEMSEGQAQSQGYVACKRCY